MPQYELNLRDYFRIFRKRRLVIIIAFVSGIIFGAIYLSKQRAIYVASSTIKIEERKTIAGLLTEWIIYNPADIMESQTRIIRGTPVMKKVALHLGMINNNSAIPEIHSAVNQLQGSINTEIVGRTNIIKITATSDDPKMAVKLANTVAEAYVEESLLEKTKQARATRQFIEEQLLALKKRFNATEENLKRFEKEVKGIKLAGPIQEKLINLEFELNTLMQKYTDKHPSVIALKEQIQNLESQLEGFSGEDLEYARLLREVEVNKKLYSMFMEKLEEARITEAQKISDVSIVDPAVIATSSGGPQKGMGAFIGGLMGLIVGFVLAFVTESLDTSLGTIEDIENVVKLPVLGVIPSIISEFEKKQDFFSRIRRRISPIQGSETDEGYIRLFAHYRPKSSVSEAFRNVRTNLKLGPTKKTILITSAGPGEGKTTLLVNLGLVIAQTGAKTLLVSSDLRRPAVEKTFGVERKPGLNEVVSGMVSLEEALKNISDIILGDQIKVEEIIKAPGIENIVILPSGHAPFNTSEILESKDITNLMAELKNKFDVILFDSPPVLPITDASLLASKVDSVVLVYEIGRMSRNALLRAKIQLESVDAKISGVILNQVRPQTDMATPYPYYYYRYKYGYYGEEKPTKKAKIEKGQEKGFS